MAVARLYLTGDNAHMLPNWALSGGTLIFEQLVGTSSSALGAGIIAALEAAGWIETATLTNGATLQATSPQGNGLTVFIDLVWTNASQLTLQLHNTATGYLNILACGAGLAYQIVCGPCQFFISQPTVTGPSGNGSNVAGGIPYIAPVDPVYGDGALPDECWWSVGDGVVYGSYSFRNALGYMDQGAGQNTWCGYFHRPGEPTTHALVTAGQGVALMCLELGIGSTLVTGMRYGNFEPILYEPLLAWGDYCAAGTPYTGYPPKVRGQIWDSCIISGAQISTGEQAILLLNNGTTWLSYTLGAALGNLCLLLPGAGGPQFGNVAY